LLNALGGSSASNGKTLLHLGSQNEVRGCSVLIEAMAQVVKSVPEARLLFVGAFQEPDYEAEIHRRIALSGLKESVVLTGQVPYADVPRWLARSSIGLIALQDTPQFRTCIPTKLFEYMGSKLPVVSSDLPPARQFMQGVDCGFLVDPADPQAYAEKIEHLIGHPVEAKRMGENGREAVEREYNWETEAQKLVHLYQELE
jgi:glycosyltransferase involved in cell wall biosynthesis